MSAEALVTEFCERWSDLDVERLLGYLSEDCVYHNIPLKPCVGHDQIRKALEGFLRDADSCRFEIKHTTATGDVVMNERVDHFELGDKTLALPVVGVFEVKDGKITAWRDYFDLGQFKSQMAGAE